MGLDSPFHSRSQPEYASQSTLYRLQPWYEAYMAALLEVNRGQMKERIRTAEQLILSRERELLAARADLPEQRILNNALHALRALHACLKSKS